MFMTKIKIEVLSLDPVLSLEVLLVWGIREKREFVLCSGN